MPPVAVSRNRFGSKKGFNMSWRTAGGRPIDGFPFELEETAEAPQRFANIHGDVLSLTGAMSPQRRDRNGLGGQTNRGHTAKPMSAGNDRVPAVEGGLAAAVRRRHPDVFQYAIEGAVQVANLSCAPDRRASIELFR